MRLSEEAERRESGDNHGAPCPKSLHGKEEKRIARNI